MKFIFGIFTILAALTFPAGAKDILIGTEASYAPWNFVDDNGQLTGFEVELADALCDIIQVNCTFTVNRWDTMIPDLNAGKFDVIMAGMSITTERLQVIDFSQDYYPTDPSRFVTRVETTDASPPELTGLAGQRIGVQTGTIHSAFATENLSRHNEIVPYETVGAAMMYLLEGELDFVLADQSYLRPLVAGANGILTLMGPDIYVGYGVALGLRKGDDALRATLNVGLKQLKIDGTLDILIYKWFGKGPFYAYCTMFAC